MMNKRFHKIALGGGCHWCTEAVFQALNGVEKVEQGYVASAVPYDAFSEAVIVHFEPEIIPLEMLIEIHLHTHKSTSNHSFRSKYRSAIYFYSEAQKRDAQRIRAQLQEHFEQPLITQVLAFKHFQASRESLHDYYKSDPEKPFCKTYIVPKLQLLMQQYGKHLK
ncbi:MAG: peptide-methionine (S)-S-oxide reductase [Leeuwenhoekiella sp.]|nr:peptide-methionine (S)-S-oxide reductase [Leeuwenhoekiella blandensis]|tara:strand:- start:328 stop:822 length:495 start_codon:yes stop_codon:yes gene_type:complete